MGHRPRPPNDLALGIKLYGRIFADPSHKHVAVCEIGRKDAFNDRAARARTEECTLRIPRHA